MNLVTRDARRLGAGALAAAGLTGIALFASVASARAATVGDAAPAFTKLSSSGQPVSLDDFQGKTVILEWTNAGCPYVQNQYATGAMQRTQAAAVAGGAVWISVISSAPGKQVFVKPAEANALTRRRGAHPSYVLLDTDGALGHAYGAKTPPDMFVISPTGKSVYSGAIDSIPTTDPGETAKATNYVAAALASLRAGKSPDPALTRPYGCSIKY